MCADPGSGGFLETVRQILSGDNALRGAAERRYEEARRDQPAATVAGLFQVLQEPRAEQPVREQAAVLLRRCFDKAQDSGSVWARLGEGGQADVRQRLLQVLEVEPLPKVRRKVADCAQSLGNQLIELLSDQRPKNAQAWPELMPTLMRIICDRTKDAALRADCLWVVKELAVSVWQILVASADQSFQVLKACLTDPADVVRANAASLLCTLVDQIESREDRKPFAPLIPEVAQVITLLAGQSDPAHLRSVLQSMQLTTETADFFKNHVASHLMPVMCQIAKSHPDEESRKYAFEVMISFVESKPKLMVKVPRYLEQVLDVCIHFMLVLEDDPADWAEVNEEEGDGDEDAHAFGKEAMDRVCRCAAKVGSFPQLLEVLKPALARLFQTGDWKQAVAGTSALSQLAEYVDDEATVVQMMTGIRLQLGAAHARVRYAAWGAVAQFAEDHAEVITTDAWAAQLLPEFLRGLDDACGRVAIRCMEAFQHYGESVEREDLEPFIQPLMEKLGAKLQAGQRFQRKAITFIAVIAGQVDDAFAPYYGPLMPHLKQVIQNTLHKVEERTLLGKCFECISLLAKAVGRAGFLPDAEAIMQAMIQATKIPNLPINDPVKEYMMAASERICTTMKEDFLPFVPHVLPGVLEKLQLQPRELDGDAADNFEEGNEVNLSLANENGEVKVLIMYSSELQDLKGALECVHTFVEELGRAYAPFVGQTAQALLPVFEFSMAEEIRDLAFETWGQLCGCARQDGQVQVVSELVLEFLKRVLPKFEATEVDAIALKTRADGVTTCLKKAGPGILSAEQVRHLCKVALALVEQSFQRRDAAAKDRREQAAAERAQAGGGGGEEVADDEAEENEEGEEQALRVALCEVAGAIMQHHPDLFAAEALPSFLALVQQLARAVPDDRKLALFVVCDFLEHLGARVTAHWEQFLPLLLEDALNKDPELRQPACYGLSVAARDAAFAPLAATAAPRLAQVVTESRGRSKKKSERMAQACADNALMALVEILLHHAPALGDAQARLWGVWLAGLPCQEDEQEGARNHATLLRLLQQERPEVVGAGGQHVPRLLSILVDVYKTDMADEETSRGIAQLVLRLGEAKLEQLAAGYSERQRKRLLRALRDAQRDAAAG